MTYPPELCALAERLMWFEQADEALRYPNRFLAYLMTYGTIPDILLARKYFTDQDFEAALSASPPGIFDPRSWAYWNGVYKRHPIPPLPTRVIPE